VTEFPCDIAMVRSQVSSHKLACLSFHMSFAWMPAHKSR